MTATSSSSPSSAATSAASPGSSSITNPDAPDDGRFNYWLTIDEAAIALGVGKWRAYQISRADRWKHTRTTPRGYLAADIRRTAQNRKASHGNR